MTNLLAAIENIIYGNGQPWIHSNLKSDANYAQINASKTLPKKKFVALTYLDFPAPITPMRNYYFLLVGNTTINFLNTIINLADNSTGDNDKLYWVHKEGFKAVIVLIEKLNTIITYNKFDWAAFQGSILGKDQAAMARNSAYVAQLLKYNLLYIIQELQFQYPDLITDIATSSNELHARYFDDQFQQGIILETEENSPIETPTKSNTLIDISQLDSKNREDKEGDEGTLTLTKILVNRDRFDKVERQLVGFNILNKHYEFIKNRRLNHSKKFAAVVALMFEKKYFKTECFLHGIGPKKISRTDIGRVLGQHYGCLIEKQFRNFTGNDTTELNLFITQEDMFFKLLKT